MEGIQIMTLRSAPGRLAVTLPFFAVAALVLALSENPQSPPRAADDSPLILIVTTEELTPAFQALDTWNQAQGCRSNLLTLGTERETETSLITKLGEFCREQGASALLLGGDRRKLPMLSGGGRGPLEDPEDHEPWIETLHAPSRGPIPAGVLLSRAPVTNLDEAWAFVEACRRSGETLDRLIGSTGSDLALLSGSPTPAGSPGPVTAAAMPASRPVP